MKNAPNGQLNTCPDEVDLGVCGADLTKPIHGACEPGRLLNADNTPHEEVDPLAYSDCAALGKGYSAVGIDRQQLKDGNPKVVSAYRWLDAVCSTCEHTGSLASPAGVQAKHECLVAAITDPKTTSPAYGAIAVDHAKQLFETYGHWLTPAQVDDAADLYGSWPAVVPACGRTWSAPAETSTDPSVLSIRSALAMCTRLTGPEAAPAKRGVAGARLDYLVTGMCVAGLEESVELTSESVNASLYVEEARELSKTIASTGFKYLGDSGFANESRATVLDTHLSHIATWYPAVRRSYSGADAAASVSKDTSAVTGALWASLYASELTAIRGSSADDALSERDLTDHLNLAIGQDLELLQALVPPDGTTAPLKGAPALYLLSDSLSTLSERLGWIAPYHDLGCKFLGCRGRKNEVIALNRLLASIHDKTLLDDAIAEANTVTGRSQSWATWKVAFENLSDQHEEVLAAAVKDAVPHAALQAPNSAEYRADLVLNPPDGSAEPLKALSAFVRNAHLRSQNQSKTGLFLDGSGDGVSVPLLFANKGDIKGNVENALVDLEEAIVQYDSGRASLATALLDEIELGQTQDAVLARTNLLVEELDTIGNTMAELRLGGSIDGSLFATETLKFEGAMRKLQAANTPLFPITEQTLAPISAKKARYSGVTGSAFSTLADVAVLGGPDLLKVSGMRGDVLGFKIVGSYSPTCAISRLNNRFANLELQGAVGAKTGPEGFELTYSAGSFTVHSFTESWQHRWSASAKACGGYGYSGGSVEACIGYDYSHSRTTDNVDGRENRTSAGFAKGLRLPTTPFPEYPTGALLAIQLPMDASLDRANIRDIQVLQSYSALPLQEDVDVYFVVNDAFCSDATQDALTVTVTRMTRPMEGNAARNLVEAMSQVVTDLGAQWTPIIEAGRILPDQMGGIRVRARTSLMNSVPQGWQFSTYYPEVVSGFFDSWLHYEVVKTERAVDLIQLNREYKLKLMQVRALYADLEALQRKGRLQRMIPTWTLANLDGSNLRGQTDYVAYLVSEHLHPFVHFRYPEALSGFPNGQPGLLANPASLVQLVDGTPTINWTSGIDQLAQLVRNAVTNVTNFLDLADGTANEVIGWAVVRFPNPSGTTTYPPPPPPTDGTTVDVIRAAAVWDQIRNGEPIHIELRPEDLYGPGNLSGVVPCRWVTPVITAAAFVFESNNYSTDDNWNGLDKRAEVFQAPTMEFVTEHGPESVRFTDRAWLYGRTKVLWADKGYALEEFLNARVANPLVYDQGTRGTSPAGVFDVSPMLGTVYPPASGDEPYSLILVLELETISKANSVFGVEACP